MALIFGTANPTHSRAISRAVAASKLRKLAAKIYTDDLRSSAEDIIRYHRLEIAAHFYPGAIISHRSALEGMVSPKGKLHLSLPGAVAPVRKLPGLEIRLWRGPAPQPDDIPTTFGEGEQLFAASLPRAILENMQIARARANDEPKTLSSEELEHWIDRQIRIFGTGWLEQIQKRTAELAARLGWRDQQQEFAAIINAMRMRNHASGYRLSSDLARSRALGKPYDPERDLLFRNLHARLANEEFRELPAPPVTEFDNRAFWESYFSNFVEGTKFTIDEARTIVYAGAGSNESQRAWPEDAHIVRETYQLIVDSNISAAISGSGAEWIELLKRRHARMMASRPEVEPGVLKKRNNEIGSRVFVAPDMVEETLSRGWQLGRSLPSATGRALFVLFLLSEVHPFNDGNGRISRLGMNAELEAVRQMRLIIPTSFQYEHLSALAALTLRGDPNPFIKFGHKLIELNSRLPFSTFRESHEYFRRSNALD